MSNIMSNLKSFFKEFIDIFKPAKGTREPDFNNTVNSIKDTTRDFGKDLHTLDEEDTKIGAILLISFTLVIISMTIILKVTN